MFEQNIWRNYSIVEETTFLNARRKRFALLPAAAQRRLGLTERSFDLIGAHFGRVFRSIAGVLVGEKPAGAEQRVHRGCLRGSGGLRISANLDRRSVCNQRPFSPHFVRELVAHFGFVEILVEPIVFVAKVGHAKTPSSSLVGLLDGASNRANLARASASARSI